VGRAGWRILPWAEFGIGYGTRGTKSRSSDLPRLARRPPSFWSGPLPEHWEACRRSLGGDLRPGLRFRERPNRGSASILRATPARRSATSAADPSRRTVLTPTPTAIQPCQSPPTGAVVSETSRYVGFPSPLPTPVFGVPAKVNKVSAIGFSELTGIPGKLTPGGIRIGVPSGKKQSRSGRLNPRAMKGRTRVARRLGEVLYGAIPLVRSNRDAQVNSS
jgi:hypothetical protein